MKKGGLPKEKAGFIGSLRRSISALHFLYLKIMYFTHVRIRFVHDKAYQKSKAYKKYSDMPVSNSIHKATLVAFLVSMIVFNYLQFLLPMAFNPAKPSPVLADVVSNGYTQFISGTRTGSSYNGNVTGCGNCAYGWSGGTLTQTVDFGAGNVYKVAKVDWTTSNAGSRTAYYYADSYISVQIAVNSDNATWNYVGPDGTSATSFTDGNGTLIQPGKILAGRYVRYKVTFNGGGYSFLSDIYFTYYTSNSTQHVQSDFATGTNITNLNISSNPITLNALGSPGSFESPVVNMGTGNVNAPLGMSWNTTGAGQTAQTFGTVTFQIAGSSSPSGPWTYLGPDGTNATYYTNVLGVDRVIVSGNYQYFKYKAILTPGGGNSPRLYSVKFNYISYVLGDSPGGDLVVQGGYSHTITGDHQGASGYKSITIQKNSSLSIVATDSTDGAAIDVNYSGGTGKVWVKDSSSIFAQGFGASPNGKGVIINATDVVIDAGSNINSNGGGYPAQTGPGVPNNVSTTGGGASHGGVGGDWVDTSDPKAGPTYSYGGTTLYGSSSAPIDLGSGSDGPGGGAIKINNPTGTLTVNGSLLANGSANGSGGSIWTNSGTLSGSGAIQAIGENRGGGGRIALYANATSGWTVTPTAGNGSLITGIKVPINNFADQQMQNGTSIKTGGTVNQTTINLRFWYSSETVQSRTVVPQFQILPLGSDFDVNTPVLSGASTTFSDSLRLLSYTATVTNGTSYHWRARISQDGTAGDWFSYGGNLESAADFVVNTGGSAGGGSAYPDLSLTLGTDAVNTQTGQIVRQNSITLLSAKTVTLGSGFALKADNALSLSVANANLTIGDGGSIDVGSLVMSAAGNANKVTIGATTGGNITLGTALTLNSGKNIQVNGPSIFTAPSLTLDTTGTKTLNITGVATLNLATSLSVGTGGTLSGAAGSVITTPSVTVNGGTLNIPGINTNPVMPSTTSYTQSAGTVTLPGYASLKNPFSGSATSIGVSGGTLSSGAYTNINNPLTFSAGTIALGNNSEIGTGAGSNLTFGTGTTATLGAGSFIKSTTLTVSGGVVTFSGTNSSAALPNVTSLSVSSGSLALPGYSVLTRPVSGSASGISVSGGTLSSGAYTKIDLPLTFTNGTINLGSNSAITSAAGNQTLSAGRTLTMGNGLSYAIPVTVISGGTLTLGDNTNPVGTALSINLDTFTLNNGSLTLPSNTIATRSMDFVIGATATFNFTIGGNSILDLGSRKLTLSNSSLLIPQGYGVSPNGRGLTLNAGDVTINTGSKINSNGGGYGPGTGPGSPAYVAGDNGCTPSGAAYGGVGGQGCDYLYDSWDDSWYYDYFPGSTNTYGSASAPNDLGSGSAGAGGGAVKIVLSGTLQILGTGAISADGVSGGSGGSIWIDANALTGTGTISAKGGDTGGGGMAAFYLADKSTWTGSTLNQATITTNGSVFLPPSKPSYVYDVLAPAQTDTDFFGTAGSLSSYWAVVTDTGGMPLLKYQYAIGFTPGGTEVRGWTDNPVPTDNKVTASGLTLIEGTTYYVSVRAVNTANAIGASKSSNGAKYDITSPSMTSIGGSYSSGGTIINSGAWQPDRDPYFLWSAPSDTSGIAGYWWAINNSTPEVGGTFVTDSNGTAGANVQLTTNQLADGQYSFYVRAQDKAGNKAGSVSVFSIWVDSTGPTITTTNQGNDPVWHKTGETLYDIDFTDGLSGLASYQISINGGSTWSSVVSISGSSYSSNWPIPNDTWAVMPNGTSTISIRSTDVAGSVSTALNVFTVKKDVLVPTASVAPLPAASDGLNGWFMTRPSITLTSSDANSGVSIREYHWDADAFQPYSTGIATSGLTDGTHDLFFHVVDIAGNEVSGQQQYKFDNTAPSASIVYNGGNSTSHNSTTINFSKIFADATSDINDVEIQYQEVDINLGIPDFTGATWLNVGAGSGGDTNVNSFTGQNGKAYKFRIKAQNKVGLWGAGLTDPGILNTYYTPSNWVGVDSSFPTGSLTLNNGKRGTNNLDVTLKLDTIDTGRSGLATYQLSPDNGSTWGAPVSISGASFIDSNIPVTLPGGEGVKIVKAKVQDNAGNETEISNQIIFDTSTPSASYKPTAFNSQNPTEELTENSSSLGWYPYGGVQFKFSADDNQSGIESFKYCWAKQGSTCDIDALAPVAASRVGQSDTYEGQVTINFAEQGIFVLRVVGVDYVGNNSAEATYTYKYDQIKPAVVSGFDATKGVYEDYIGLSWASQTPSVTPRSPIEEYKIERLDGTQYHEAIGYNTNWSTVPSLSSYYKLTCKTSGALECRDGSGTVVGNMALVDNGTTYKYRDYAIQSSFRYVYRISAKDYSNTGYGDLPDNNPEFEVYGYTMDTLPPETYPTVVKGYACDGTVDKCSDISKKGKQIKIDWLPAFDSGSGIKEYEVWRSESGPNNPDGWTLVDKVAETADAMDIKRVFYDNTVVDAKRYSYRIIAVDDSAILNVKGDNKTQLFKGYDYMDNTNVTVNDDIIPLGVTILVPDITAPVLPTKFNVIPAGIDCEGDCEAHQKIIIGWNQTSDNTDSTTITYELYRSVGDANSFVLIDSATKTSESFIEASGLTKQEFSITQTGLADKTTYYYKLLVKDGFGNEQYSQIRQGTTGNSQAPTPPTAVEVYNNDVTLTDQAHQLKVKFTGSYAKAFDEPTGDNGIVAYEGYRSTTNISPDVDGTLTAGVSSDNCQVGELSDECWIRINGAQKIYTLNIPAPKGEDRQTKREFLADSLVESTRYYFRIRAIDNGKDSDGNPAALKSQLSAILDNTHTGGWDITRDLTAPVLPGGGLDVKVKDTHKNELYRRNIVTWKILTEQPLRRMLDFEKDVSEGGTCKMVSKNSANEIISNSSPDVASRWCNDFGKFEVYRQVVNNSGDVLYTYPDPVAVKTDPNDNLFIDNLGYTDDFKYAGSLLVNLRLRYYVVVVDNSVSNYKYPDGSSINAATNKTDNQYSAGAIVPSQAQPVIYDNPTTGKKATLDPEPGVASATINWKTDQPTDSLVEYWPANDPSVKVRTIGDRKNVYDHTVEIFDLKPGTTYHYNIVSRNYLGNEAIVPAPDDEAYVANPIARRTELLPTLTTAQFTISPPPSENPTTTSMKISWGTNKQAKSNYVEWFIDASGSKDCSAQGELKGISGQLADNQDYNLNTHEVLIKGLKSDSQYCYRAVSVSTDGFLASYPATENQRNWSRFQTRQFDSQQFSIKPDSTNVAERNISASSAQIVWKTSIPTTSKVDYSTDPDLKNPATTGDEILNYNHSISLDNLASGQIYFYRVWGEDEFGQVYRSEIQSFKAIAKPKVNNIRTEKVSSYEVTIAWETNVETETTVNWGESTKYGKKIGKPEKTRFHVLTVDNLTDDVLYHYQIIARDEYGNEVATQDYTVRTPLDTVGPKVTNVKVDMMPMGETDTTASAIISWTTDKPSTTKVEYDEGVLGGKYSKGTTEDLTLNSSHTVIIKDLAPATTFHFRIVAKDKRGNQTLSNDYNFLTSTQEKSIWQLIVKTLEETFSWIGSIGKLFSGRK
jgi:hypothetical protein